MDFRCQNCPICGSKRFEELRTEVSGQNTYHTYRCLSCDGVYSSKEREEARARAAKRAEPAGGMSAAELFRENVASVLELSCGFGEVRTAGTGIVIAPEFVLTNAHVLVNPRGDEEDIPDVSDEIFAREDEQAEPFRLEFVSADFENDMALLRMARPAGKPVRISERDVKTGDRIFTIGNSKGEGMCMLEGLVSDRRRQLRGRELVLISAIVTSGNSGGPLFSEEGGFVGMVTNGRRDAVGMNYAIPLDQILFFLRDTEEREEVKVL